MRNLTLSVAHAGMVGRHIAYDTFLDEIMWAPADGPYEQAEWRAWRDSDYAWLRVELEQRGFKPMGQDMLRLATLAIAERHRIDQAQVWLDRLSWDGVPRVDGFAARAWGWSDSPYATAVSRYVWSALAGRVIEPGVQADMAPILVGGQGLRKTSTLQAMAPSEDFYTPIDLKERDADASRRMRGKLILEIEELRGLKSRDVEDIKAYISRRREEWVPKYREFAVRFMRRALFFGTTNLHEILADPTGERRWLPGECEHPLDPQWVKDNRDQLWAEGASLFLMDGVLWQDAERLAPAEHHKFKEEDAWSSFVERWLEDETAAVDGKPGDREFLTTHDVLVGAINLRAEQIDRKHEMRAGKVLRDLGFVKLPRQRLPGYDKPVNAYVRG